MLKEKRTLQEDIENVNSQFLAVKGGGSDAT
jgi:hypothetical protein